MELEKARRELMYCLARASEYRDNETGNHVLRVGAYAGIIADELGLEEERVLMIQQAATLHDLGKIGMPDSILLKPEKLTPEEFELIQKHCGYGKKICRPMSLEEFASFSSHTRVWRIHDRQLLVAADGACRLHRPHAPREVGRLGLPARACRRGYPH